MFTIKANYMYGKYAIHGSSGIFGRSHNSYRHQPSFGIFPAIPDLPFGNQIEEQEQDDENGNQIARHAAGILFEKKQLECQSTLECIQSHIGSLLGGGFNHVFFIPIWGNDPNLTNIFQLS